jgi:hypothetical protein
MDRNYCNSVGRVNIVSITIYVVPKILHWK